MKICTGTPRCPGPGTHGIMKLSNISKDRGGARMDRRPLRGIALSLAAFTALALAVYACAVNPVTGRSELSLVSFSPEEEVALGAKAYGPAVQQQGGFSRDNALEAYVRGVGMRLAGVSHRPDQPH